MAIRDDGEHVGAVVATLAAGAIAILLAALGAGLLVGLPAWQVLVLALVAPLSLSSLSGLALAGFLLVGRPDRVPSSRSGAGSSPARATAQAEVTAQEQQLLRAVQDDSDDTELMRHALALHAARLQLANVLLAEEGDLPQSLKDELLVAHRGTSAWLQAGRPS